MSELLIFIFFSLLLQMLVSQTSFSFLFVFITFWLCHCPILLVGTLENYDLYDISTSQ